MTIWNPERFGAYRLSNGDLLVKGKTWTAFVNLEEDFASGYVGQRIQPFRIEGEYRGIADTKFMVRSIPPRRRAPGGPVLGQ